VVEGAINAEDTFALAPQDLDPVALLRVAESVEVADVGDRAAVQQSEASPEASRAIKPPSTAGTNVGPLTRLRGNGRREGFD